MADLRPLPVPGTHRVGVAGSGVVNAPTAGSYCLARKCVCPVGSPYWPDHPIRLSSLSDGSASTWLSDAAEEALSVEEDYERYEELRHWHGRSWAMETLAYTAERDDVTAALAATYCASIHHGLGSEDYGQFLTEAVNRLNM